MKVNINGATYELTEEQINDCLSQAENVCNAHQDADVSVLDQDIAMAELIEAMSSAGIIEQA